MSDSPIRRPAGLAEKVRILLELVKFEHSVFALPYAYIGALYAAAVISSTTRFVDDWGAPDAAGPYMPDLVALLWITVAMVGARSFAFAVNRAVDKEIDARNPRTAGRAVPAGLISAWELWLFAAVMLATFLVSVWQLAPVTHVLWPIPLIAFVVYPYTKRFTPLCHYWLGACLGLAPAGAWVAVGGPLAHPTPWLLGVAVAIWTAGFDIIYATQDVECDRRDRVHSMPADFGIRAALVQTRVTHALTVVLFVVAGLAAGSGWSWYLGVAVAAALLLYENMIVSADDMSRVNAAFFTMNGMIAMVLLAGAVLDRLVG